MMFSVRNTFEDDGDIQTITKKIEMNKRTVFGTNSGYSFSFLGN